MPELPEAETVARDLSRIVVGKCITDVIIREPKALNLPPEEFKRNALGRIREVRRRAKAVVLLLENDDSLWLHMGLRSVVGHTSKDQLPPSPFLALIFDDDSAFYLDKTFMGYAHFVDRDDFSRRWSEFGIDPLDDAFTVDGLKEIIGRRASQAIKNILMDQQIIAGIGNIFSDEILHAAKIHPSRKAATLTDDEARHLHGSIRQVLSAAVDAGGGPEWAALDGKESDYRATVHGQERCTEHDSPIVQVTFGSRTAYVCEKGQT